MKRSNVFGTIGRDRQRGQMLVIFALGAVALIAMVGVVLDGGGTFVQRRGQQNTADLAALAGANAWLLDTNVATRDASTVTAARAVATQNGYTDGVDQQIVNVTPVSVGPAETVQVDIGAQHRNAFASIAGMPTWRVSTTATAIVGKVGSAEGSAPIMFHAAVFNGGVDPTGIYADPANPFVFGDDNNDYPDGPDDIAWTDFGQPANVDTAVVRAIINGSDTQTRNFTYGDYIGQENQGNHSALFGDTKQYLSNQDVVVPIVDGAGRFQGWALFHIVTANQGGKTLTGYFKSGFSENGVVCTTASCPVSYGLWGLKLIN